MFIQRQHELLYKSEALALRYLPLTGNFHGDCGDGGGFRGVWGMQKHGSVHARS
jgi:hypothetical protein